VFVIECVRDYARWYAADGPLRADWADLRVPHFGHILGEDGSFRWVKFRFGKHRLAFASWRDWGPDEGFFTSIPGEEAPYEEAIFFGPRNCISADAGPGGDVYVVVSGKFIIRLAQDHTRLAAWGGGEPGDGVLSFISDVAVAPDGTVYAADMAEGGVQYFTANGSFLGKWGYDWPPEERLVATALDVGPDGDVFVAGYRMAKGPWPWGGRLVYRFGPTGALKCILRLRPRARLTPGPGIAVAPDGTIYVAERDWGRVSYYKPVGFRRRLSMLLGSAVLLAAVAITAFGFVRAAARRFRR
jgi:hypothetical protein